MCQECFEGNLKSQIGEDLQGFINRKRTILCSLCVPEAARAKQGEIIPFSAAAIGRVSGPIYELYLQACAEKHVIEALAIQEHVSQPKKVDAVQSALDFLIELDRCPGPGCNVPFEHTGDCNS